MRIALVSEHANPLAVVGGVDAGGQNVHVAALASGLTRRGHDVTVFTRRDTASAPARVTAPEGYVVEHVPAGPPSDVPKDALLPHLPAFTRYLRGRWQDEPVDLVHAHFWMSGVVSVEAARGSGVPVVQTFHALGSVKRRHQGAKDTSPPSRVRLERALCRHVSHVVGTCRDEVDELLALGLPREKASVIPCGVDVDSFRPRARWPAPGRPPGGSGRVLPAGDPPWPSEPGCGAEPLPDSGAAAAPGGPPRLLVIGRLVERKGVGDVVRALAHLPGVELLVAGGPEHAMLGADPEVARLTGLARGLGVLDRVRFLGAVRRADVPAVISAADVVVAVPWYEPFGIVPVEAMACGRPVVGSAVGGLLDTVVPGVTGELVPPRRPDLLARALRRLLADPGRREAYGAAGRARAVRTYQWRQVVAETEAVYERVLAASAVAGPLAVVPVADPAGGLR